MHPSRRSILVSLSAASASYAFPASATIEALFAPGKKLWPRWTAHDSQSRDRIDHAPFDTILRTYLADDRTGVSRFAYARVTLSDRAALRAYLAALAATPISRFNRDEQLAYWINLYNALTLAVVLDHYPVQSIRDINISPSLFASGPWDKKLITVEGDSLTLNDIEHRIFLRPIWNDRRIHYAVNCASIGCPNLQNRAFTSATVAGVLDEAARTYFNHPRGAQLEADKLIASKIYDWFQEDFGGSEGGVIAHLRRYAEPKFAAALTRVSEIDRYEYDWKLNDAALAS
jgi:hypothetical protein